MLWTWTPAASTAVAAGVAGDGGRNRVEGGEVDLVRIDAEGGGDLCGRIVRGR